MRKEYSFIEREGFQKAVAGVLTVKLAFQIVTRVALKRWFGLRSFFDHRFNYGSPDEDHVRLPVIPVQILKNIIFVRGMLHNNYLFSGLTRRCLERIGASLKNTPVRKPKEIERIHIGDIGAAEFYEKFVRACRPVILTGVKFDKERWDFDQFKKKYSDVPVLLTDLHSGKTTRQKLEALFNQGPGERLYAHNCESLWAHDSLLLKSLRLKQFEKFLNREMKCAQIFVGVGATNGTDMHCTNNFNVFYQIKGAKKWRFVNPEYTPLIFPVVARHNGYFGSLVTASSDEEQSLAVKRLLDHCPRFETVVQEGEVLFNPPLWWHSVGSVAETPDTLSVSTRWGSGGLGTIIGDMNLRIDCVETNHLLTTLQLPLALSILYPGILHDIKLKVGQSQAGESMRLGGVHTEFEENSHDDIPEEVASGKMFEAFEITR
jgi:hypothetical protein